MTGAPLHRVPGLLVAEHRFTVPLAPGDEREIALFAREIRAPGALDDDRPTLLMLNGGPGMAAQRPQRRGAWLERALQDFHVVLLDQRGTGLSTPATAKTLAGMPPAEQAAYLRHFRADAIVRDAEHVRAQLLGDRPWTVFGQSFGGFTALTYLSFAPEGVEQALITGGLPSLERPALDVYRATFARVAERTALYLDRYPEDEERWRAVFEHVERGGEVLPDGRPLTARTLRGVGIELGRSTGPEVLHHLVETAFAGGPGALTDVFLEGVRGIVSFATAPLYAVLHEAIYAEGEATAWAAQRALDELDEVPLFTGEMVFPHLVAEDPALLPLREAAELLAAADDWPALYDRTALAVNPVPAVAAVYLGDMYVESAFSLRTAAQVGSLRVWATNEHDHDGIHAGPVLDHLLDMAAGER